jgi:hypothetical protein
MSDREDIATVATEIIAWEATAQQMPLSDLTAMLTACQNGLAKMLNTFNDLYADYADHDECADVIKDVIGDVAKQATATAIFALGLSRRAHQVAHQN